jgi:hypothetical protein
MHTRPAKFVSVRPFRVSVPARRTAASLLTLLAGFTISACSAFFVPDADDDGVARCNTGDDCPEPDDNRHVAQCVFGEAQAENSDKVCSSAFRELGCHPQVQNGDGQLEDLYDDVTSNQIKALYSSCSDENDGKRGCEPGTVGCADGLEEINGICDDPDALYPAINPSQVGLTEIAGQDVLDQFCRFYFCDESFVCDQSGSKPLCRPCDPNEAYGEGGCGTLYIQGAASPVYTHIDEDGGNCNGEIDLNDVEFGPAPSLP